MNGTDQKRPTPKRLAAVFSAAALIMAEPGMAHQPPGGNAAPEAITRATIVHTGNISAMTAMILDAPQPALMIRYQGDETLTVYDSDNKPFLRFAQSRVEASTRSRHWQTLPQSDIYEADEDRHWVQVSGSGSFGWVDPRLSADDDAGEDSVTDWRIPLQQGDRDAAITGRLSRRALTRQDTDDHH
ncbi:hypothetical protein [Marinobacter sp. HL-58]|uniref:hypothetical protein n=1 Tax=Marinobacter sp. HL-58 TaxID=1479237 RepID=UPI00048502C2|nr:hypothetical protein [Marinobacter sp. HL-58]KPP99328.1 MAG: hypothetical protein HLUCCO03_05065 [Marinobacter sp. HL-58]